MVAFIDDQGRRVFVSDGIIQGRCWGVYRRKPSGSLQRIKSVPIRWTRAETERDLEDYAAKHGWRRVEP